MTEQMIPYIVMSVAFLIVIVSLFFAYWNWKRISISMENFSQQYGLQYQAPAFIFLSYPSVSGMYRGHGVTIKMYRKGTGKSSKTYTALEVTLAHARELRFHIYEAGWLSAVGKMFGMQDAEIGDEMFDKKFIIKTDNPAKLASFLNSSVKESFIANADKYTSWGIEFNGMTFSYHRQGSFGSPKMVRETEDMMNFCCDLADQFKYIQ